MSSPRTVVNRVAKSSAQTIVIEAKTWVSIFFLLMLLFLLLLLLLLLLLVLVLLLLLMVLLLSLEREKTRLSCFGGREGNV